MSYGWEPVDLTAAEFAADPEPPSIAGLLYDGKRHVISGPPESLKTLVAWIIVLEAQSIRVAHIDFEMGATATRKMLDELGAPRDWIRTVYHVEPDRPPTAENIDAIVAADVKLAIIDAAAGAFDVSGLDDNKRSDAEAFARAWIRPLWQAGITTLLVDHVTKNADTRGKFTIGTERKVGQADVHLGLEAVKHLSRGGNGLVKVHVHKDRVGFLHRPYAAEINVTSDPVSRTGFRGDL